MRIVPQDSPTLFDGRVCSKCGLWKLTSDFYWPKKSRYPHYRCKQCDIADARQRQATYRQRHDSVPVQKVCSWCKQPKPASDFCSNVNAFDGLHTHCKECQRIKRAEYTAQNKEKVRLQSLTSGRKRREAKSVSTKIWRQHNRERVSALGKAYRRTHQEEYREHRRNWYKRNRDYVVLRGHIKRARIKGNGGTYTTSEWKALCECYGNRCLCCGEQVKLTVDHIVPLSKGGRNDIFNLQPLCLPCNMRKHDQTIDYRPQEV